MRYSTRTAIAALFLAITVVPAMAQETFDFYQFGPYRQVVPTPTALLGYQAGARHTQYDRQQFVLDQMVVAAGDRVRTETIGVTEEGRMMRVLIISSPANLRRLDRIRRGTEMLADPRSTTEAQADSIAQANPVTVFLSYSVHGYEAAGFETAMWFAYHMLASESAEVQSILDNVLLVINPSANPDGHERLAVWYNSLPGTHSDEPWAMGQGQGGQPWEISGRYSHYRFDMNRDLIALSQAPTRAVASSILRWKPSVVADLHSTTGQYFFPPNPPALHPALPEQTDAWIYEFGEANAETFDAQGWPYYVREFFDLYYPGYYDLWPTLLGATGMTYETDGGPQFAIRKSDGTVTTFHEGIAHHFMTSKTTVETAAANRVRRNRDFFNFRRDSYQAARQSDMRRIVIAPGNDRVLTNQLATLLARHGLEVSRTSQAYTVPNARDYMNPDAQPSTAVVDAGAIVVDLTQPQALLAEALLEPEAGFNPGFVEGQLEKYNRNQRRGDRQDSEGYDFYDVTAWSLPLTFGMQAYWTDDQSQVSGAAVTERDSISIPQPPARGRAAYLVHNEGSNAAALVTAATLSGLNVGVATEPVSADGAVYPAGTFVLRVGRNGDDLHDRIRDLAVEYRVNVVPVASGFPGETGIGVGSEQVVPVRAPKVIIAAGQGINQMSFGALWQYMEQEARIPFVAVETSNLGGMQTLNDYNVLIIPGGFSGSIRSAIGSRGISRISDWVSSGGVLIAYDGSGMFLSDEEVGLSSVEYLEREEDSEEDEEAAEDDPTQTPPLVSPTAGSDRPTWLPGSIFKATLDNTHWLTFGYQGRHLPVMVSGGGMLKRSEDGDNPVAFVGTDLKLSGFVWPDTEEFLEGSVWASVESRGSGNVVIFGDDPLFRGFWRGTARLLLNAILMGSGR